MNCIRRKSNKGITLIALVITIIILLILVGVTILTLNGENGILGKSQTAKEETNKQTATEIIQLKITNIQIETYGEKQQMPSLQELADGLYEDENDEIEYVFTKSQKEQASLEKIKIGDATSIFTKLRKYPYEFEIDRQLKLASINGIKVADSNTNQIEELKNEINLLKEQNENLKPKGINEKSLLLSSNNSSFVLETVNLNSFANDFKESFEEYFSYNETTGELTCKKDGWYGFDMRIAINLGNGKNWTNLYLRLKINNLTITTLRGAATTGEAVLADDSNFISLYLKKDDKIEIEKATVNDVSTVQNEAFLNIFKL